MIGNRAALRRAGDARCYTITGQRSGMADASGVTTNFFDARDRLVHREHYEAGSLQSQLDYEFDARGNLASTYGSTTIQSSQTHYAHDGLNRLAAVADNSLSGYPLYSTGYRYDLVGNLESCQTTNGVTHQYRFNSLNRLTNLVVLAGAVALAQFDYALGVTGQRDKLTEHVNVT